MEHGTEWRLSAKRVSNAKDGGGRKREMANWGSVKGDLQGRSRRSTWVGKFDIDSPHWRRPKIRRDG